MTGQYTCPEGRFVWNVEKIFTRRGTRWRVIGPFFNESLHLEIGILLILAHWKKAGVQGPM